MCEGKAEILVDPSEKKNIQRCQYSAMIMDLVIFKAAWEKY